MSWVAFGHHWCWLECRVGNFSNWELFVISFLRWDNWRVWTQHKVDTGIWDQIGLEFGNINVQGTIESQWGSQRWNDLGNESVQVGVCWSFNIQLSSADVINGFVIKDICDISVFQKWVSGQNWIVWLNNSCGDLGRWIYGETEFWFLSVINWESFQKEWSQSWSGTTTNCVENHESLETSTVVCKFSDSV